MHSATVILSLLAAVTAAQPHKQAHQHRHVNQHKRENAVKWVTEYEYTTEVVPVTETVWVSEGFVPPTTSSSASASSKPTVPAQFFQPDGQRKSSSTSVSLFVPVAPVTSSAAPTSAPPAPKAPEPETSSSTTTSTTTTTPVAPVTPVAVAPAPVPTPEAVTTPPAPTTPASSSAPAPVSSTAPSSGSGSSDGQCSEGSPCEGDITHYDANAGIGACGWQSDGNSENVMALPHELMGTQSNGNPYCGRMVTITLNGKSTTAKIVDKCMGCTGFSIDLSDHAFSELAAMGVGRTQASWYFSS